MKQFFSLFRKLYSDLIPHLIVIWLLILVTSIVLLGMYYAEDYLEKALYKEVVKSSVVVYIQPEAKTEEVMMEILTYPVIENHRLITSMQTITELQQTYGLSKLPQWVDPKKIPDFVHANLSPTEFTPKKFTQMLDSLSVDQRIQQIDFNDVEVARLGTITTLFRRFRWAPQAIVLMFFCVVLFLTRRLMRARQKEKWHLWKGKGFKHIFKVPHLILEFLITAIIVGGLLELLIYLFGDDLLHLFNINILQFNDGWRSVCVLFGLYIVISLINLMFKDKEKARVVFKKSGKF
ncbi:MAG TPA: hypothetical protein ENK03_02635 [Candidatus Cloacimonetes bacterium]|nr:hypothetical protein [Candidatus Cloacimonadota bacterium]